MFAALSLLQLWRRRELVVEMLHAYVLLPYLLLLKLLPKLATTSMHAAATVAIASAAAVANGTPTTSTPTYYSPASTLGRSWGRALP